MGLVYVIWPYIFTTYETDVTGGHQERDAGYAADNVNLDTCG